MFHSIQPGTAPVSLRREQRRVTVEQSREEVNRSESCKFRSQPTAGMMKGEADQIDLCMIRV